MKYTAKLEALIEADGCSAASVRIVLEVPQSAEWMVKSGARLIVKVLKRAPQSNE
jgi:hypothetical protein